MSQTAAQNDIKVEDIGSCLKKLTITIPAEIVAENIENSLASVSASAALPGFRPGRVPKHLVQKRFGSAIEEEARNQLVSSAYAEAIREHKLSVIGEPEGGDELKDARIDGSTSLTFSIEVEVAPEFDTPTFEGIEIKRPDFEVTDDLINEQIDRLSVNEGALETQEQAQLGDYCIGRGVIKDKASGEELLNIEGAVVQVPPADKDGRGAILGVMVDDLGSKIGTPKPGDSISLDTKGPDQHEKSEVRGKDISISFNVERVERIIPASLDDMLTKFGMAEEKQLREAMTLRLNQQLLVEQQAAMRQQVAKTLLESVDFELPGRLTDRQSERNLERMRMEMQYRGTDPQEIEEKVAERRAGSEEVTKREVKLFFILSRLAQEMEIGVNEDEVNGRIAQIASQRGTRPEELRAEFIKSNQIQMIAQQVREHKTLDTIISKAVVQTVSPEAFRESMKGDESSS